MKFLIEKAFAQGTGEKILFKLNELIFNPLITILFSVALLTFLFGIVEFLSAKDNQEKVAKGKRHMLYGIIGFFIMLGAFGILNLITDFIGVNPVR